VLIGDGLHQKSSERIDFGPNIVVEMNYPEAPSRFPHEGDRMHNYKAYLLGRTGNIVSRVDLDCNDDEAAKKRANALVGGHDVELWDGARKIAEFKTSGRSSAPEMNIPL
jgi:hypothetical protein